jgi:formylglycine-generating enzyme required for sulfatase activity
MLPYTGANRVAFSRHLSKWKGAVMSRKRIRRLSSPFVLSAFLVTFLVRPPQPETQAAERQGKGSAPRTITNSIGMKLVLVPAGKFKMGSSKGEQGHEKNETEHEVEITRPYYMGAYAVTQEEYEKVMDKKPSYFSNPGGGKEKVKGMDTSRFPAELVSWKDARDFCKKLIALDKKKGLAREYRLPTEAEWEYACREAGKSTTPFYFGAALSAEQANFDGNYPYGGAAKGPFLDRTTKVGSYKANKLGLYDMHGNVWQWCLDWYGEGYYAKSDIKNPQGPETGKRRVLRGGSYLFSARYCRAACRNSDEPTIRSYVVGFRIVCVVSPGIR